MGSWIYAVLWLLQLEMEVLGCDWLSGINIRVEYINKMKFFKTFFFSLLLLQVFSRPIAIKYGSANTVELFRFFYGVENDFYLDLGAYDAIARSNTLDLYIAGWDGVNIDASPTRLSYFLKMRKDNINLGMAVGEKDKFVTLYEMKHEGGSTISQRLSSGSNKKSVVKEVNIPSVGLSTVCERYFYKRPSFFNLDIEGYGAQALSTNNWTNQRCRPEVIFTELNDANKNNGFPLPSQILIQNNYTQMTQKAGENEIFIANQVLTKYNARKQINTRIMANYQFIYKQSLEPKFRKALGVSKVFSLQNVYFTNEHYDPQNSQVFLAFSRVNKPLDCKFLRLEGKRYEPQSKDRPILVLNFNPHKSALLVESSSYTISTVKMEEDFQLFNLTITADNQEGSYSVYIFNHRYEPELTANQLPITVQGSKQCTNKQATQAQPQEKNNFPPNAITVEKIQAIIKSNSLKEKIQDIQSEVSDSNKKLEELEAKNNENFQKVIDQLGRAGSSNPEIAELKNSMTKMLEKSNQEKKQFIQKLTEFEVFVKLMQSKVGESSDVSEKLLPADSQFDFLLKVILFQTSILVLLIITIGVVVLLKFKNKEFLNIERGSSTRVEVADTD